MQGSDKFNHSDDGKSNWFEGVMLIAVYLIIAAEHWTYAHVLIEYDSSSENHIWHPHTVIYSIIWQSIITKYVYI
jgi:hypothetical protein